MPDNQTAKEAFLRQLEQETLEQEAGDGNDKKSPEYIRDTQSEDEAAMEAQTAKLVTLGLDPRKMSPEALAIARDFLSQRRNNSEFTPDLIPPEHFPEGTDEEKEASEKRRLAAGPKWTLRPGRTFAPEAVSDKEYAKDYDAAGQNTDEEREANTKEYKKRLRSAKRKADVRKAQTPVDAQFPNGVNAWEVGAKAGDAAQTYRTRAAGYGNSAQDEQKALYDAAESAQRLHDKVPGWVAQNMPVDMTPAEPTIPTWAEMKKESLLQTPIDAHDSLSPDLWEDASDIKNKLNATVAHRDKFKANNIDGKKYSPSDLEKVKASLERLNRQVAGRVDDHQTAMNAIKDVSEDADIFDARKKMERESAETI